MPLLTSPIADAKSGDVWLYSRTDPISQAIAARTFSRFMHVEVAVVDRQPCSGLELFTARILTGTKFYPPDPTGLALVLRPTLPFDQAAAVEWANTVVGQPYDLLGLLAFMNSRFQGQEDNRLFCSEGCTRFLRRGGIDLFPEADADGISPGMFAHHPFLSVVWRSGDEWQRWQAKQGQEVA